MLQMCQPVATRLESQVTMTSRLTPNDMPDVRHDLIEGWSTRTWKILLHNNTESSPIIAKGRQVEDEIKTEQKLLGLSHLWWVSEEMCDLLFAAMRMVPEETTVKNLSAPSSEGLLYFGKPWIGVDSTTGTPVKVDAISWGWGFLKAADDTLCLSISAYEQDNTGKWPNIEHKGWIPLGRSDWPIEYKLTQPLPIPMTKSYSDSILEDRRMISALWTLLNTASIATVQSTPASRPVRRRAERRLPGVPSHTRVVTLRRVRPRGESEHDGRKVNWSHQWIVSAHMRNQPCGPGNKQRRLTFIAPFVKGPSDKPLIVKETVKAWVR